MLVTQLAQKAFEPLGNVEFTHALVSNPITEGGPGELDKGQRAGPQHGRLHHTPFLPHKVQEQRYRGETEVAVTQVEAVTSGRFDPHVAGEVISSEADGEGVSFMT